MESESESRAKSYCGTICTLFNIGVYGFIFYTGVKDPYFCEGQLMIPAYLIGFGATLVLLNALVLGMMLFGSQNSRKLRIASGCRSIAFLGWHLFGTIAIMLKWRYNHPCDRSVYAYHLAETLVIAGWLFFCLLGVFVVIATFVHSLRDRRDQVVQYFKL